MLLEESDVNNELVESETTKTSPRNAMGRNTPLKSGKPLKQLTNQLPGPADYSPSLSLTKKSTPQYSIAGKPKQLPGDEFPGPSEYHTELDMVWHNRGFPMIGKGKPERYETCSLGPAAYMVTYGNFGAGRSKQAIGTRPKIIHGPPDTMVQPVDTFRFKTPGPAKYRPSSSQWKNNIQKSFGLSLKKKDRDDNLAGPASYDVHVEDRGPAYSLGKRFPVKSVNDGPGPGIYNISTTIGKSVAKSISSRNPELSSMWTPSPNTYTIPSSIGEAPTYSMTYRSFETKGDYTRLWDYSGGLCEWSIEYSEEEYAVHPTLVKKYMSVELKPSPASYRPNLKYLKHAPEYSCRKVCRPVYPDVLGYAEYNSKKTHVEGPGTYGERISKKGSPAYSMGKRFQEKQGTVGPGPAAYYPKKSSASPKYSMSDRHNKKQASNVPAANAYYIQSGQTNRGTSSGSHPTLKGRPSPLIYSGFRRAVV